MNRKSVLWLYFHRFLRMSRICFYKFVSWSRGHLLNRHISYVTKVAFHWSSKCVQRLPFCVSIDLGQTCFRYA